MPAERYFVDDVFTSDSHCQITGSEFHHLAHVMRARQGEEVELINGKGALASATVGKLGKDFAILHIGNIHVQQLVQKCRLILAQAIPKQNRLDFILEKGTELGVDEFWLFPASASAKKEFYPHQLERARHLTIAAMKQCGRLTLPLLKMQPALEKWPMQKEVRPFFGDVDPNAPLFKDFLNTIDSSPFPVLFITGPESGFNVQEVETLRKLGAKGVKLHNNILRTDTASIVALSLISHWL